ncbi:MAG: toprim domain-containing protein [Bacillota bacterium]
MTEINYIHYINSIPIEEIIEKYIGSKADIYDEGSYLVVNPCPRCGHNDCCKINTENNTLACWSDCKIHYLTPVRVVQWLFDIENSEAITKMAADFSIMLPDNYQELLSQYIKENRLQTLMARFAEECHKQLIPSDRRYWNNRGFTDEIIDLYTIGICNGNGSIQSVLKDEGYTKEELAESGLFIIDREYFAHWSDGKIYPYYLPNWDKGKVIDIQGRISGAEYKDLSLPKYKNMRGSVSYLYNRGALKEDTVILAEGIPDTISLLVMGYNAVGSYGIGGIKDDWLPYFKEKNVYIVFDSDDPGQRGAYDLALRIGENARIIALLDVKDVNELLVQHGPDKAREIIEGIIKEAKTALQIDIASLPEQMEQVEDRIMRGIAFRILELSPTKQEFYRESLAAHFGKAKRLFEDTLRHYKEEWKKAAKDSPGTSKDILLEPDPNFARLSQCFALGKVFYAQDFVERAATKDSEYRRFAVRVITSDRKLLEPPFPTSGDTREIVSWKFGNEELVMRRPLHSATRRWSKTGTPYSINMFLEGKEEKVSTADLYKKVEALFRRYYNTYEEYDYVILTLFTMFTYYFELYDAVPYIFLNGPPESGKTTLCVLIQHLAFNGDLVSNISTSSLFREAEQKQLTLLLDEQEGISSNKAHDEKGDYLAILKDAYKRTGTIKRQSAANYEITDEFQVFSPLVIANVKGLESIIKTRAIQVNTRPTPKGAEIKTVPLKPSDPEFVQETQLVRDMLYCWVMQNHQELRELPNFKVGDIVHNRSEELFQPLFALASYIECSGEEGEFNLLEQLHQSLPSKLMKRASFKTKDPSELLREACLLALSDQGVTQNGVGAWISSFAIFDKLVEVTGQYRDFMTLQWIGDRIVSSGWITGEADKRRQNITTQKRDKKTNLPLNAGN